MRCRTKLGHRRRSHDPAHTPLPDPLLRRDAAVMSGAPCFAGTRVPVQHLFDYLQGHSSREDFLDDFPSVPRAMAVAVLEVARTRLMGDAAAA